MIDESSRAPRHSLPMRAKLPTKNKSAATEQARGSWFERLAIWTTRLAGRLDDLIVATKDARDQFAGNAMSLRKTLPLVALILVVSIGVATKLIWPFQLELNRERFFAVQAAIRSAGPNPVIIFGDSIVEGAALPQKVCGYPFVNAGVRGAGVGYFLRHSAQLLGSSRPKLIVLAVGINNAAAKESREINFNDRYEQLVASLASIAPVAVATVTPIEAGYFVASFGYDPQIVPALNRTILATPNTKAVIDLNAVFSGANFTIDGVHLNATGYALWTSAVLRGVEAALGCVQQKGAVKHQAPTPSLDVAGS